MNYQSLIVPSILLFLVGGGNFALYADNNEGSNTVYQRLEKLQPPPKKHRAPSCAYIEYEYTGTGICLYPSELFSTVELNVYGGIDNNSWTETLSMDNGYYLETGTLNGTYFISATTDDGSVYQGELTVE